MYCAQVGRVEEGFIGCLRLRIDDEHFTGNDYEKRTMIYYSFFCTVIGRLFDIYSMYRYDAAAVYVGVPGFILHVVVVVFVVFVILYGLHTEL